MKWLPDSKHELVAGDYDGTVNLWDVREGKAFMEGEDHSGKVTLIFCVFILCYKAAVIC